MKLRFKKDVTGCYGHMFLKGEVHTHIPWDHEWQDMSLDERMQKNIFVECHGHGEFDVFRADDAELVEDI